MGIRQERAKAANELIISYRILQRLLGLLGLALPPALLLFTWYDGHPLEASISDFYYTKMGGYLVGTLCAVGIFLFCYNGYPEDAPQFSLWRRLWTDRTFAAAAGVFAIGVALFPVHRDGIIPPATLSDPVAGDTAMVFFGAVAHPDTFHYGSAALFFLCIFIFTTFFFPKGEVGWTLRKIIYYLCGGAMAFAILRMVPYGLAISADKASIDARFGSHFLFIWESVAVFAFSIAWLAKGKIDEPITANLRRLMRGKKRPKAD
jgi:hypothetical protein